MKGQEEEELSECGRGTQPAVCDAVEVCSGAWFGDQPMRLPVPSGWDMAIVSPGWTPPLTDRQIAERLRAPIGTSPLAELANGAKRVALIVDDLTRPTPAHQLLRPVLAELERGGIGPESVTVFIAGGAHPPASPQEVRKKLGSSIAEQLEVVVHGSGSPVRLFGRSPGGVDIWVNERLLDCDLRVGISGAYPHHESAGFSGGMKIMTPGLCGVETARQLHDRFAGAQPDKLREVSAFRREVERIGRAVGLDFILSVVLGEQRHVVGLEAGDAIEAHRCAVETAIRHYTVAVDEEADVVLSNTYPFDTSLLFMGRGMWPLARARRGASRILLGAGAEGIGHHALGNYGQNLVEKAGAWLGRLRLSEAPQQFRAAAGAVRERVLRSRSQFFLVCPGVDAAEARSAYRSAAHYACWEDLVPVLVARHGHSNVRLAVYPLAPLLIPGDGASFNRRT